MFEATAVLLILERVMPIRAAGSVGLKCLVSVAVTIMRSFGPFVLVSFCLCHAFVSETCNTITAEKIKLNPEGPFPQHNVEMRKITGVGMCYIQGGTYSTIASRRAWSVSLNGANAACSLVKYSRVYDSFYAV